MGLNLLSKIKRKQSSLSSYLMTSKELAEHLETACYALVGEMQVKDLMSHNVFKGMVAGRFWFNKEDDLLHLQGYKHLSAFCERLGYRVEVYSNALPHNYTNKITPPPKAIVSIIVSRK